MTLRKLPTFMCTLFCGLAVNATEHQLENSSLTPLPPASWSTSETFSQLVKSSQKAEIVQLGESIHLTSEMPLVRVGALKAMNTLGNADVLAIEGSALDAWLAMDLLLKQKVTPTTIHEAQRRAFFGLWQTEEMRTVIQTVAESLETSRPLYMASFDSQVGMSIAWRKENIFGSFADALIDYGLDVPRAEVVEQFQTLQGARLCFQTGFPKTSNDEMLAEATLKQLDIWIASITKRVEMKSRAHANALNLLPYNLRNNLRLCKTKQSADPAKFWRVYQEKRDRQNAENALHILDEVSANRKVITWAHHSHVHHNSLMKAVPSMGQHLRDRLGEKLYTVGTFALGGEALIGQEEPVLEKLREGPEVELSSVFRNISSENFFLNLRGLKKSDEQYSSFFKPSIVQAENQLINTVLAEDFDAVIILQKVSAPALKF